MNFDIEIGIRLLITVILAIFLGNGIVYLFNHLPEKFFLDRDPSNPDGPKILPPRLEESSKNGTQRIASQPWKLYFTLLIFALGVFLSFRISTGNLIISMIILATVYMMAIADKLYRVIPDQFYCLLLITSLGFIAYYDKWYEQLVGGLFGIGLGLLILVLGILFYKRASIGGADIKFFACIGFIFGREGLLVVFVLTVLLSGIYAAIAIATHRMSSKDSLPMLVFGAAALSIYLTVLRDFAILIRM